MRDERADAAAQYLLWALEHIDQETAANHVQMALKIIKRNPASWRPKAVADDASQAGGEMDGLLRGRGGSPD